MEEKEINKAIAKALFKARFKIIITTAVFFILALVLTYFIPKKYAAYGVVYPTPSNVITEVEKNPEFGFDIHADRLIQLFESDLIKHKIVKEFNLLNYYEVDTTKPGWRFKLNSNYANDIKFNRTKYLSVAVQANMKDPFMAANVVNRLIELIDTVRQEIFRTNSEELFKTYEREMTLQQKKVDSLLVELFINNSGAKSSNQLAINRLKQVENRDENGEFVLADGLVKELLNSNYSLKKEKLLNDYYHEVGLYNSIRNKHTDLKNRMSLPFPGVYKIIAAEADQKKVSPSYFVNGLIGLLLGFIFSLTWVILSARIGQVLGNLKD